MFTNKSSSRVFSVLFILVFTLTLAGPAHAMHAPLVEPAETAEALPLLQFTSGGHALGFASQGMYAATGNHALRVDFVGANVVQPQANSPASANGKIAPLNRVTYANLWDGISLAYTSNSGSIYTTTYTLAPGADAENIRLRFNAPLTLNQNGTLNIAYEAGVLTESAPIAWQDIYGRRVPVDVSFRVHGQEVTFALGAFDSRHALTIDPSLVWNTFLGGSGYSDFGYGVVVDGTGNIYTTGSSGATWGSPVRAYSGSQDAFVAKLNSSGTLIWNTFLGGGGGSANYEEGYDIVLDGGGNVYMVGYTYAAWGSPIRAYTAGQDAFVAKLDGTSGSLAWHTFLGGSGVDQGLGITITEDGNAYVTGYSNITWGSPLNAHTGTSEQDAFVAKLDSSGVLIWSTFMGGSQGDEGHGIALDGDGNIYVAGQSFTSWGSPVRAYTGALDFFSAKLDSSGALIWNTFLGGSGSDLATSGIAVDTGGNVYVTGYSFGSWGSPIRAISGGPDGFAAKLSPSGALTWSTFLGGSGPDVGFDIAIDGGGNTYVGGYSSATWGAPLSGFTSGIDSYVAKLDSSGTLMANTFLGGSGSDVTYGIDVDSSGNTYLTGKSDAAWGSPVRAYNTGNDIFVAKVDLLAPPSPEMNVKGNGNSITDGDTTPSSTDHTDFGNANISSGTVDRTFTIENTGGASLILTGTPKVSISGPNASDFSVTNFPGSPVTVGGSTTFTVQFNPSTGGTRTATISIANDDSNENPYNFDIQGMGTSQLPTLNILSVLPDAGNLKALIDLSDPETDLLSGVIKIIVGTGAPTSVVFETLESCGSGSSQLSLNGGLIGSVATNGTCTCNPPIDTATFTGPEIAANFDFSSSNTWTFDQASGYTSWSRITVLYPDSSTQNACLFDKTGTGCTTTNFCAGYQVGPNTGSVTLASLSTEFASQSYTNSILPASLDTSALAPGNYTLYANASDGYNSPVSDTETFTLTNEPLLLINPPIDTTPPTVVSSIRVNTNPTSASSVDFTVTFSESVTGVGTDDFALTTTGVSGASITGVSGSDAMRTVTLDTGSGDGTIRLDVLDDDTILDLASNPLNGGFTSGEVYDVDKNDAPSFISLPVTSVDEDSAYSYSIATSDPDIGDTLTISAPTIPAWLMLTDNLDGTAILTGTPGNSEVGINDVTLRVNDGALDVDQIFTIDVGNTNDGPSFISSAITSVDEDSLYSYSITASDPDVGDTITIGAPTLPSWLSFTDNGDGTASLNGTPSNAEVGDHAVVLQVSDGIELDSQSITITVANTNDDPTDISLSAGSVDENQSIGTAVGTFTSTDPDTGDTFTYTLVSGSGDTDNPSFSILGGELQTAESLDFETKSNYDIRIQSSDGNGGNYQEAFTIIVNDLDEVNPTVHSSVRANSDPSDLASVDFIVTFSESVTGVDVGDFTLTTSVSGAAISGVGGSGSVYIVTVNTGTGNGTIRLDVIDNYSIVDVASNPLGGGYTSGEVYTITKTSDQIITVTTNAPASAVIGDSFTVAAVSDPSGLPVSYSSSGACTNIGADFTMTGSTGTCVVSYDQFGDSNYNPAPQVTENVTALSNVPDLLTPADAEQLLNNQPTFDWTDVSGALSYTIQISNNIGFTGSPTSNTVTDSTYTQPTNLPNNVTRYWRVQAIRAGGPGPWSEIRSFVTARPPSAPGLASPGNNALVTDYSPLLDWNDSNVPAGTTFQKYELQIATDSAFTSPTSVDVSGLVTDSDYTPATDLDSNTTYYWRVRAFNTLGQYSAWSNVRNFRTALVPPTLVTPIEAEQMLVNRPTFEWDDVPGADDYRIQISNNAGFTSTLTNATVTSSTYTRTTDLPLGATLYWRVRSDGANGPSAWSEVRSLITTNPPDVPTLASPGNNAKVSGPSPLFDWNNSTLPVGVDFDHYQIQVATSNAFTTIVHDNNVAGITNSQDNSAVLSPVTTYYWRVRAFNTLGHASAWSTVRSVRIKFAGPTLTSPSDGVIVSDLIPTFTWDAVSGATDYTIQVSENTDFSPRVFSKTAASPTYTHTANLQAGTVYYWRVRVRGPNTYGPGDWSQVFTFTTP